MAAHFRRPKRAQVQPDRTLDRHPADGDHDAMRDFTPHESRAQSSSLPSASFHCGRKPPSLCKCRPAVLDYSLQHCTVSPCDAAASERFVRYVCTPVLNSLLLYANRSGCPSQVWLTVHAIESRCDRILEAARSQRKPHSKDGWCLDHACRSVDSQSGAARRARRKPEPARAGRLIGRISERP